MMMKYYAPLLEKNADNPYNNHLSSDTNINPYKFNLCSVHQF